MSNGSLDYSKLKDREILLLVAQKVDDLHGIPRRVAALERRWAWLTGVGSAISAGLAALQWRHHG